MPRITKAQEIENARIAKNDRSALKVAWFTLLLLLIVSIGFNALSSVLHGFDPFALIIGVMPPATLFMLSLLLERLKMDLSVKIALVVSIVVSLAFSWVHIATVVMHYSHSTPNTLTYYANVAIAWLFPIIIDVPMMLAGKSIMTVRNRRITASTPTLQDQMAISPSSSKIKTAASTSSSPTGRVRQSSRSTSTPSHSPQLASNKINNGTPTASPTSRRKRSTATTALATNTL